MIYFIAGASGSGKTAIVEDLKLALPNATIHDFDDIGVPENPDKKWRHKATEPYLKIPHTQIWGRIESYYSLSYY